MGKAFYRTYRSKKLSEVVGQQHITDALETALKNKAISHAYLFTGPRGVGKTSVARILAHEINGLPYSEDEATHLDIIEIDAASNRRIDEIRDLKDKVHIAPTSAQYKVYIIDEVHMLTKEAFNALLKTLEEPPAHVVFILATTEAHKLPDTIISRTQRYTFKPVDKPAVIEHLASIAKKEGIKIAPDALALIAAHGEGSFRDSISLLDQMRHSATEVTVGDIERALGVAPAALVETMLSAIEQQDREAVEASLQAVIDKGVDIVQFSGQLAAAVRKRIKENGELTQADLILLDELSRVGAQPQPHIALTLALYRPLASQVINAPAPTSNTKPAPKPVPVSNDEEAEPVEELPPLDTSEDNSLPPLMPTKSVDPQWNSVLQALRKSHNTLYGVVRMAEVQIGEGEVTLAFAFPFHVRRISDDKNRRIIETVINDSLGRPLKVVAVKAQIPTKQTPKPPKAPTTMPANDYITSVSNIFGGAEIVES